MNDGSNEGQSGSVQSQFVNKPLKTVLRALIKLRDNPAFKKSDVNQTTANASFLYEDGAGEVSVMVEPASQGCNVKVTGDNDVVTSRFLQQLVKALEEDTHSLNVLFVVVIALVVLIAVGWGVGAKIHDDNEQKRIKDYYSCSFDGYSAEYCDSKYGN